MTSGRIPSDALVLLVGPSCSGKSTVAARTFRPEQIVASDDLRAAVGESRHDRRAGTDAFAVLDQIVAARLRRRLLTVVDTLGLDAGRRAGWIAAARARGMPVVALRVSTEASVVRARNRARTPSVPAAVLRRQIVADADLADGDLLAEGVDRVLRVGSHDPVPVVVPPVLLDAPGRTAAQRQEPLTMRFGLQIPRFDADPGALADHLREVALAAEAAGFHSLWLMDHMVQIPQIGREWEDMLEPIATLSYLAAVTSRIRLGTLVIGITYRNIAHLGKAMATLDVLSGGRVICGLGAAWFEREHTAYGYRFPDLAERYDLLRDALDALPLLWGPGTPAFQGRTITLPEAICYPRPLQERIPLLIGGSGERTTLRLVAEHADACNLFGDAGRVRHLIGVLHRHCAEVGRDPDEIEVTTLGTVLAAPDAAELARRVAALTPADRAPEGVAERLGAGTIEDQIGRFRTLAEAGVGTAIVSLPELSASRVAELEPLVAAFAD